MPFVICTPTYINTCIYIDYLAMYIRLTNIRLIAAFVITKTIIIRITRITLTTTNRSLYVFLVFANLAGIFGARKSLAVLCPI